RFINRNTKIILDHASVIYKQKISGLDINYLNNTLDFRNLEKAHDNF
ncbi:MAG: type III toxin-antitoxin system ToxN/AbiQ family toxin, partial [Synergistaceae bacterium]|nr:type III toxin-antitoxin system ToxN/AbiQ family toxin [Synergistaceae bacterium]